MSEITGVNLKRSVKIYGHLDGKTLERATQEIEILFAKDKEAPIDLLMASSGGMCEPVFVFINYFTYGVPAVFRTIAFEELASMAIPLFMIGETRCVCPGVKFFFHPMAKTFGKEASITLGDFDHVKRSLQDSSVKYNQIITERSGEKCSLRRIKKLISSENYVETDELIKLGLVHGIL